MNDIKTSDTSDNGEPSQQILSTPELVELHTCKAIAGWSWFYRAYTLFSEGAFKWIGICFIWLVIIVSINMVPLGSFLSSMMGPLFTGGFIFAAQRADLEGEFEVGDLFEGFRSHIGNLFVIGSLYAVGSFLVFFIGLLSMIPFVEFDTLMGLVMTDEDFTVSILIDLFYKLAMPITLTLLVISLLMMPLIMALWFAPILAMLHGVPGIQALKMSFHGCVRNLGAFTVYALVAIPLVIVSTLPLGLGWLILGPVLVLTTYTAYKDIFVWPSND
ncbi:MAG: hypothetical protein KUG82_12975 [Pseudomonadales bacterium]|nr:hypothetical protein [Pseudomonadales bacterium]